MTKEKGFAPAAAFAVAVAMAILVALAPFCAQRAQAATSAGEPAAAASRVVVSTMASKAVESAKPKISPAKMALQAGKSKTVKVKKGTAYRVASKTFKSSNPKVAKVGKKSGKVTALKAGTAKVTATVKAKPSKAAKARAYKLTCRVTVSDPAAAGTPGSGGAPGGETGETPEEAGSTGSGGVDGGGASSGGGSAEPGDAGASDDTGDPGDATAPDTGGRGDAGRTPGQAGKVLVAYYSGTGNTERIAEVIAARLGADTFAITPVQPYTSADLSYTNGESRVYKERNDPNRNVELAQVTPDGFGGYDTVLIGYPIWWGEAPHVMYTLVEALSLKGKTVVPFCTSMASGVGSSAKHLKARAITSKKTKWKKGKSFYGVPSQKTVARWVAKL